MCLVTNTIAIGLGLLILGGIGVDAFISGGEGLMFLARKGLDFLEWIAVWR